MKQNIRSLIREFIQESELLEDYPSSFSMEVFKSIKSHAGRNQYAQEHLQKLSSGSSRIVYKIDEEKVLKLAKNNKGIAQNETEIEQSQYYDIKDVVARTFDYDENNLWVEMELAKKMNKSDFKRITNISFDDFSSVLKATTFQNNPSKYRSVFYTKPSQEIVDAVWEDPTTSAIINYMLSYDIPYGDLTRTSSYGIVKRDGHDDIVLIDYGLTEDILSTYYS